MQVILENADGFNVHKTDYKGILVTRLADNAQAYVTPERTDAFTDELMEALESDRPTGEYLARLFKS